VPRVTAEPDRAHHIRAVADHFLAPPRVATCPASGRDAPGGAPRRFRFAVAAADSGALAAWLCARLAAASLRLPMAPGAAPAHVTLEEWHRQPWSAGPFLGGSDREHLAQLFRPPRFGARPEGTRRWACGVELSPPRLNGGADPDRGAIGLAWLNLGRLTAGILEALEALHGWDGGAPLAEGLDGLVWCRDAVRGARLRDAYRLGRLIAAMGPRQVRLVVVGDSGVHAGDVALARRVAPGVPLEALGIAAVAPGGGGGGDDPFLRLAGGMALAAAATRRERAAAAGAEA